VLDRYDTDAALQGSRHLHVVGQLVASDPVVDLDRVRQGLSGRMEGDDLTTAGRGGQIVGERRDAASSGRVRGGECDPWYV
jgi:hypothetical protein